MNARGKNCRAAAPASLPTPNCSLLSTPAASARKASACPIEGRVTFDRGGAVVGAHPMPQLATSWDMLYRRLRGGLPEGVYRQGRALVRVEALAGSAVAEFAGGERAEGDLLIGCDGVRSTVRRAARARSRARYAGYVAWRGMIPEGAASAAARERLGRRLSFCLPPGEQFLCYPVAGEGGQLDPGDRRLNWVWYRPRWRRATSPNSSPGPTAHAATSPCPPTACALKSRRTCAPRRRACCRDFHFELVALTRSPSCRRSTTSTRPKSAFGRAIVMGDAAFVARPHTGFGVTKAVGTRPLFRGPGGP